MENIWEQVYSTCSYSCNVLFLVFSHGNELNSYIEIFKTKWLFTSIIVSMTSSVLFVKLTESFVTSVKFHTEGLMQTLIW